MSCFDAEPRVDMGDFAWSDYARINVREKIVRAREDPNAFIEYVGDGGGEQIYQEPAHREWQDLITDHEKVVILGPVGSGKSTQVRLRLLWEIGRDPDTVRIAYISQSEDHPKKQAAAIKELIERNPKICHVFPHLRASKKLWAAKAFSVQRKTQLPDPTFQIYGVYGKILGSRKTWVILDDLCSFVNTLTAASKQKMSSWLTEVMSRLKGDIKVVAIGHIWAHDDPIQRLAFTDPKRQVSNGVWGHARYEAHYNAPDGTVQCTFPRVLPQKKIEQLMEELGPIFGEMMLYNRIPVGVNSRFKSEWIALCLEQGRGHDFWSWKRKPCQVITGIDLGHTKKPGKDLTVMITAALYQNAAGYERRQVIDVRSGHWSGPEIIDQMADLRARFDGFFYVESNGGQQYISQFAEGQDIPTFPVWTSVTGANGKWDLKSGIEGGLGGELKTGMWVLPCHVDEYGIEKVMPGIDAMIKAAYAFNPDPTVHTPDELMAWWILRNACELMRPRHKILEDPNAGSTRR